MVQTQDIQCGQCNAINKYEYVTKGDKHILRCRECTHEKVIAIITTSSTTNTIIKGLPVKVIFDK